MNKRFRQDERKPFIIANHRIRANELRVLSDTGEQLGVMQKNQAQNIANEQELDLVLIVPNAEPQLQRLLVLINIITRLRKSKKRKQNRLDKIQLIQKKLSLDPQSVSMI